jgi:phosphate transport system substrate-binding protein
LLAFFLFNCTESSNKNRLNQIAKKIITIKGSDTEFLMVQDLTNVYLQLHPEAHITLESGGSNEGIKSLTNKEIPICNSSRKISDNEMSLKTDKNNKPIPIIFSADALAIFTNYKLGVESLSTNHIKNIFNGTIKSRKELGGDDIPIRLFGRDKSKGTRNYFSSK